MLANAIQEVISQEAIFPKLKGAGEPYLFYDWSPDGKYFRYIVKHKGGQARKRVIIQEIKYLLAYVQTTSQNITRKEFEQYCPTTLSDGPCGFAVIAGVLSYLKIGQYKGSKTGIFIEDRIRLKTLLQ